jgi:dimethylargininase
MSTPEIALMTYHPFHVNFHYRKEFFVGLSHRTDLTGVHFLAQTFPNYRVTPISINEFKQILHLKSACSMCGPDHILVGGDLGQIISNKINEVSPSTYKITYVSDPEAANCLYINGTLIRRTKEEFPLSADQLDSIGGKQLQVRQYT